MNKFIRISEFAKDLFTDQKTAEPASQIMLGIIEKRSPRLSDIATSIPGSLAASYQWIQRFLYDNDPQETLKQLFNEEADM